MTLTTPMIWLFWHAFWHAQIRDKTEKVWKAGSRVGLEINAPKSMRKRK